MFETSNEATKPNDFKANDLCMLEAIMNIEEYGGDMICKVIREELK